MSYKFYRDQLTGELDSVVQRLSDGVWIPFDEANMDYLEYLAWVADGNTTQAAD